MSSRRSASRTGAALLVALLPAALLLPLASCGKKGPPEPPLRFVPKATEDLTVAQQGRELAFTLSFPTETTSGAPMPPLDRLDLWALVKPASGEGASEPVNPRELEGAARLVETLNADDLRESTVGGRIAFRVPLPETEPPQAYFFAVRTEVSERDVSAFSNQAPIVPRPPPPLPEDLNVTGTAEGVEVAWRSPEPSAFPGGTPPVGYRVYRRDPHSRFWGEPIHEAGPSEVSFVDTGARFGEGYVYTVTTVMAKDPAIESAPGGAREIEYRDRFAPPPPGEPVALPETGQVRLVWAASPAPDVAGYHVYKISDDPEGEAERLTPEPVRGLEYLDRGLPSGITVTYRVTAVDGAGNESEPTAEIRAEVR